MIVRARDMAVGASHERKRRKRLYLLSRKEESRLAVEPSRDGCVKAQGLLEPMRWRHFAAI